MEEKIVFALRWSLFTTFLEKLSNKLMSFFKKIKKTAMDDKRRITHSFKVGLALTLVSIFYYVNPLYKGFDSSAIWAILTVVVVMEYSVGATLSKGLNRAFATLVAGALGLAAHYLAAVSSHKVEPVLLGIIIFVVASAATFSRFIPEIKARCDYGVVVFILTFSLVAMSSYRVEQVIEVAHQRLSTIAIGVFICLFTSIFVFPVWAGEDLHNLVAGNLEKLACFLEGLGAEYFAENRDVDGKMEEKTFFKSYKSVLSSKSTQDNLANFAWWEPCHGKFKFRHPWSQYNKIGSLSRQCACYLEALTTLTIADNTAVSKRSEDLIRSTSAQMSTACGNAMKEMYNCIRSMTISQCSDNITGHVAAAKAASEKLAIELSAAADVMHAAAVAALLVEVVKCVEETAAAVEELARLAGFKCSSKKNTVAAVAEKEDEKHEEMIVVVIDSNSIKK